MKRIYAQLANSLLGVKQKQRSSQNGIVKAIFVFFYLKLFAYSLPIIKEKPAYWEELMTEVESLTGMLTN